MIRLRYKWESISRSMWYKHYRTKDNPFNSRYNHIAAVGRVVVVHQHPHVHHELMMHMRMLMLYSMHVPNALHVVVHSVHALGA